VLGNEQLLGMVVVPAPQAQALGQAAGLVFRENWFTRRHSRHTSLALPTWTEPAETEGFWCVCGGGGEHHRHWDRRQVGLFACVGGGSIGSCRGFGQAVFEKGVGGGGQLHRHRH
jgi:hypothetical protein